MLIENQLLLIVDKNILKNNISIYINKEMEKTKFKADPYNKNNKLITSSDVINIMLSLNINDFKVNNLEHYKNAFVHESYTKLSDYSTFKNTNNCLELQDKSYETMEFLGDSLLGSIVCNYLYKRYTLLHNENEGFLTKLKNKIVNGETLAYLASHLNFNKFLIISNHLEVNCNGRENKNILEDTLEAFICAIYLDQNNYRLLETFIINLIEKFIDFSHLIVNDTNYKDQLLRYFHNNFKLYPKYNIIKEDDIFHCNVIKEDIVISSGKEESKKKAEQLASKNALIHYGVLN